MELLDYEKLDQDELVERIRQARKKQDVVILAHNYQRLEIQRLADHVGDSLGLSRLAASSEAKTIVFCGVHFMAETAKILSPEKTVLLPDIRAGCPLADFTTRESLLERKSQVPEAAVVCYVNSTAEVKAASDICCTSANAIEVCRAVPQDEILFVPDFNLGKWCQRNVPEKKFHLWPGYCSVHHYLTVADVASARGRYPGAKLVVHPECTMEVIDAADAVASTGGMVSFAREHDQVVLGTETGMVDRLRELFPEKKIYPLADRAICPNMKLITLPRLAWALEKRQVPVEVPQETRQAAARAVQRMIEIG